MRCGVADQAAVVPGFREMGVDDSREEAIGPVGVHAIARRVEFLHFAPQSPAVLEDGDLEPGDALVRNVDDVLRVMQEGYCVVIAPKKEDLPIEVDESLFERLWVLSRRSVGTNVNYGKYLRRCARDGFPEP